MNNIKRKIIATGILTILSIMALAIGSASAATYSGTVDVRAFIDGSDYVYIQFGGAAVWYNHLSYDLPGVWGGNNYPTYVDSVAWYPSWSGSVSDKYLSSTPHPTADWTLIALAIGEGRGLIAIDEYPTASNGYTAKIYLDDNGIGGADWYQFTLLWTTETPFVVPEYYAGAIGSLSVCLVAYAAYSVIKNKNIRF